MRNNVVGRTSPAWKLGAAAAILFSQPVLAQGTMAPGAGGSMAPQPRAAPAPVQTPQAPIVPTPSISSPGLPITGTPTGSPDRGKIGDNQSPRPTDRSIPVATPAVPQPGLPATVGPQALPVTGRVDGKTDGTPAIFDRWGRSPAIFDRWGSSFAPSRSFAPIPRAAVVSSQGGNSAVAQTQTDDKGIFTVGTGQAGAGRLSRHLDHHQPSGQSRCPHSRRRPVGAGRSPGARIAAHAWLPGRGWACISPQCARPAHEHQGVVS